MYAKRRRGQNSDRLHNKPRDERNNHQQQKYDAKYALHQRDRK